MGFLQTGAPISTGPICSITVDTRTSGIAVLTHHLPDLLFQHSSKTLGCNNAHFPPYLIHCQNPQFFITPGELKKSMAGNKRALRGSSVNSRHSGAVLKQWQLWGLTIPSVGHLTQRKPLDIKSSLIPLD